MRKYKIIIEYAKGGNWRNRGHAIKTINTDFKWYLDQEIERFERNVEKAHNIILSTTINKIKGEKNMSISELIKKLEEMKEKHGDVQVCIPRISWGTQDGWADIDEVKYNEDYDCVCFDNSF